MAYVEFVIPANKDELLQGDPGQYSVTNVCTLPELSEKLSGKFFSCMYCNVCNTALSIPSVMFLLDHPSNRFLCHLRSKKNCCKVS
jgi:hypothetical protein